MSKREKLQTMYLHEDGHAVLVYETFIPAISQKVQYCDLVKNYGPACHFQGRMIFFHCDWEAWYAIAKDCICIRAFSGNGSDKTRKLGIEIQSIEFVMKKGSLWSHVFKNVFGGPVENQPQMCETWEEVKDLIYWCDIKVRKVIAEKQLETAIVV